MTESLQNIKIQRLVNFSPGDIPVDVLRLDLLHPIVSGNKWFKLRYHLEEAIATGKTTVATFGGAWSNHIVATAFAAAEAGLGSVGLIRGDQTASLSPTLQDARNYGMELVFVDREAYRDKEALKRARNQPEMYWIMEGGYGPLGAKGAGEILGTVDTSAYTHILCAAGTGTMMAGLINASGSGQTIEGISVLKNNLDLENDITLLLNDPGSSRFHLHHSYHFGGYAKQTALLFDFMKGFWATQLIPTDLVYTSKLLFGTKDLLLNNYFPAGSRLLVIHSGGLQGNRSLPTGKLPF